MTAPHPATDESFDSLLPRDGAAVVDFWAPGCAPCVRFAPVFQASAAAHPDVVHLTVDASDSPGLVQRYEIQAIPTTVFFRDGLVALELSGGTTAADLADLIAEVASTTTDAPAESG